MTPSPGGCSSCFSARSPCCSRSTPTQREAQERLDTLARELAKVTSAPVATVVLFGEPATALRHFALGNGYELIVAGSVAARWHVSRRRAGRTHQSVPVLIGPTSLTQQTHTATKASGEGAPGVAAGAAAFPPDNGGLDASILRDDDGRRR